MKLPEYLQPEHSSLSCPAQFAGDHPLEADILTSDQCEEIGETRKEREPLLGENNITVSHGPH